MSFLYNLLFGKPVVKPSIAPSPLQTIHSITEQEAKLEKKISYTRIRMQQYVEEAKECLQRNEKTKALACMKQKGVLEEQEKSYVSMLEKLTQQRLALEMNQMQQDTLQVMKKTNDVFLSSETTMDIEKAQDIFENFEEKLQTQQDISRLFAQPLASESNEQQAEEELHKLMQDMVPVPSPESRLVLVAPKENQQEEEQATETTSERVAVLS